MYQEEQFAITLSEREHSVLHLMCDNHNSQEIADKLFLSKRTIEIYRRHLLIKFKAKNAATLVKKAIDHGLLC